MTFRTLPPRRQSLSRFNAVLVAVLLWAFSTTSDANNVCTNDGVCKEEEQQCGLYLAPSTIPNAGLGIFTTKPIQAGELIGYGGDVAIAYMDYSYLEDYNGDEFYNPFEDYVWEGPYVGMHGEISEDILSAICPGVDAAVNCNTALINIGKVSSYKMDTAGLHRSENPGAGGITPYYNGTTYATADIPPGGELFKWYGAHWFDTRIRKIGLIPFPEDYDDANVILKKIASLKVTQKAKEMVWETIVQKMPFAENRLMVALRMDFKNATLAARDGIRSIHQPAAVRSTEELEQTGRCMDNIRPGRSTIKEAGRGAFATRNLSKNTIVTGAPVISVPFREFFDWKDLDSQEVIGKQILLNYCFGHASSTLLLCPYGSGVGYINHNASRANVKIQWTPNGILSQHDDVFDWEVDQMYWRYTPNLALDIVATRDIMEGEEILLDYGIEWQQAWNDHVKTWKPMPNSETYAPASEWNLLDKLKTKLEQEMEPYPPNVELRCHSLVEDEWKMAALQEWALDEGGIECNVLYRAQDENGKVTYEVELPSEDDDDEPKRVLNVPRAALKFIDTLESTDPYLRNAFRHEIMIPDEIFPDEWRNLEDWD